MALRSVKSSKRLGAKEGDDPAKETRADKENGDKFRHWTERKLPKRLMQERPEWALPCERR